MKFSKISILSLLAVAAVSRVECIGQLHLGGDGTGYRLESFKVADESDPKKIMQRYFALKSSELAYSCDRFLYLEEGKRQLAYLGRVAKACGGINPYFIEGLQESASDVQNCEFCKYVADQLETMKSQPGVLLPVEVKMVS